MEILLFIGVCVVFSIWTGRPTRKRRTSRNEPVLTTQKTVNRPDSKAKPTVKTANRFETDSSTPVQTRTVITGAAYIIDGDTIKIKQTQVRLFGIDAPELNHPFGQKSKWALHKLCKGNVIRAEITARDAYGRTVARCFLPDGRDLSEEMVKQGLAVDWKKFSGGVYKEFEPFGVRKNFSSPMLAKKARCKFGKDSKRGKRTNVSAG